MPDPIVDAYADCIHIRCRNCRAAPDAYCLNPITDQFRGTPCVARIHDAESENNR